MIGPQNGVSDQYHAHPFPQEWETIVTRSGRWIDFENDYKTMNLEFMESVWQVFQRLWKQGLVYLGNKVMPYSNACSTPLSNFEANMNYKDVEDPSGVLSISRWNLNHFPTVLGMCCSEDLLSRTVIVSFPLVEDPSVSFLAWTTTPWTLPSNLALCVHPAYNYVKVFGLPGNLFLEWCFPPLDPCMCFYFHILCTLCLLVAFCAFYLCLCVLCGFVTLVFLCMLDLFVSYFVCVCDLLCHMILCVSVLVTFVSCVRVFLCVWVCMNAFTYVCVYCTHMYMFCMSL